jgi:hypothetical protein
MPADPEEASSHTGVAGEISSFPSPSSSTDVPAGLNTDTDASANQGPLPPRLPQRYNHVYTVDEGYISTLVPEIQEPSLCFSLLPWQSPLVFSHEFAIGLVPTTNTHTLAFKKKKKKAHASECAPYSHSPSGRSAWQLSEHRLTTGTIPVWKHWHHHCFYLKHDLALILMLGQRWILTTGKVSTDDYCHMMLQIKTMSSFVLFSLRMAC